MHARQTPNHSTITQAHLEQRFQAAAKDALSQYVTSIIGPAILSCSWDTIYLEETVGTK